LSDKSVNKNLKKLVSNEDKDQSKIVINSAQVNQAVPKRVLLDEAEKA